MSKIIVGKSTDIPPGQMKKVPVNGQDVLVCNIDGNYFAIDDTCTHAGASLSEGNLDGCKLVCGWHAAEFDCKTGRLEKFPAKIRDLQAYNVVVESDDVFIEI